MRRWRTVTAGTGHVVAGPLADSSQLYRQQEWRALRERFAADGCLLIRAVLPKELVEEAQRRLLEELTAWRPECFEPAPAAPGTAAAGASNVGLLSRQDLAALECVQTVLEAPAVCRLAAELLQAQEVATTAYKWLRAVAPGEFTGAHTDRVFVGRGSERLLTIWLGLGATPIELGPPLVCRGSHRSRAFAGLRKGYGAGRAGADGAASGWLTADGAAVAGLAGARYGVDWRTENLEPGDVVVLALDTLHMSATNVSRQVRLSCDTRWQPAAHPRDPKLGVWRCLPVPAASRHVD